MLDLIKKGDTMRKDVKVLKDEMNESRRLMAELDQFFSQPLDQSAENQLAYKTKLYDQLELGMNKLLFRAQTLNQTIEIAEVHYKEHLVRKTKEARERLAYSKQQGENPNMDDGLQKGKDPLSKLNYED